MTQQRDYPHGRLVGGSGCVGSRESSRDTGNAQRSAGGSNYGDFRGSQSSQGAMHDPQMGGYYTGGGRDMEGGYGAQQHQAGHGSGGGDYGSHMGSGYAGAPGGYGGSQQGYGGYQGSAYGQGYPQQGPGGYGAQGGYGGQGGYGSGQGYGQQGGYGGQGG